MGARDGGKEGGGQGGAQGGTCALEDVERRTSHLLEALSDAIGTSFLFPPPPFRYTGLRPAPDAVVMAGVREHRRYAQALLRHLSGAASVATSPLQRTFLSRCGRAVRPGEVCLAKFDAALLGGVVPSAGTLFVTTRSVTFAAALDKILPGLPNSGGGGIGGIGGGVGSGVGSGGAGAGPGAAGVEPSRRRVVRKGRVELSRVASVRAAPPGLVFESSISVEIAPSAGGGSLLYGGFGAHRDAAIALINELVVAERGRFEESRHRRESRDHDDDDDDDDGDVGDGDNVEEDEDDGRNGDGNGHGDARNATGSSKNSDTDRVDPDAVSERNGGGSRGNGRRSRSASDASSRGLALRGAVGAGPGDVLVAESYENERLYPIVGWSARLLVGERDSWSDRAGRWARPILDEEETPAPDGWRWAEAWHREPRPDEVGTSASGDPDGWAYAPSFSSTSWAGKRRWNDVVRRRRWSRLCVRSVPNEKQ